ncbi:uncharacterized protein N7483_001514 [Penicillium malachiteum]|uniref:uncharacterized protein n=1 Tax=Penicillium malachiteum TaxID=1324776 RepID=UPI00254780A8|nr:uncharacterized protein N7483_001514 [Penicillium malachiteum]KAJ5736389.1 hypothetical protein N7483_001514 [Penicillium malachiteum]
MSTLSKNIWLPKDLWQRIVDQLRDDRSPNHLSHLIRTCKWFHENFVHLLYQNLRFFNKGDAIAFGNALLRQEVKDLVEEIRHEDTTGFLDFTGRSNPFFQKPPTLTNLKTLILKRGLGWKDYTWYGRAEDLLHDAYMLPDRDWPHIFREFKRSLSPDGYMEDYDEDPLGIGWEYSNIEVQLANLGKSTFFCHRHLSNSLLTNLRICHIGGARSKLCIADADYIEESWEDSPEPHSMKALKELTLLNCRRITAHSLQRILSYPVALKKFLMRSPFYGTQDPVAYDADEGYIEVSHIISDHQRSMESMDLDIWLGTGYGMDLDGLHCLKELTVRPYSMTDLHWDDNPQRFGDLLSASLMQLTLRFEEGATIRLLPLHNSIQKGSLPELRTVSCIIPDDLEDFELIVAEVEGWKDRFKALKVDLIAIIFQSLMRAPDWDACPCEHPNFNYRNRIDEKPSWWPFLFENPRLGPSNQW